MPKPVHVLKHVVLQVVLPVSQKKKFQLLPNKQYNERGREIIYESKKKICSNICSLVWVWKLRKLNCFIVIYSHLQVNHNRFELSNTQKSRRTSMSVDTYNWWENMDSTRDQKFRWLMELSYQESLSPSLPTCMVDRSKKLIRSFMRKWVETNKKLTITLLQNKLHRNTLSWSL